VPVGRAHPRFIAQLPAMPEKDRDTGYRQVACRQQPARIDDRRVHTQVVPRDRLLKTRTRTLCHSRCESG
jgi:hypothetical protein